MAVVCRRTGFLLCLLAGAITLCLLPGVARAAGPTITAPPTISGKAQQGQMLTLTQGTWTDSTSTSTPPVSISDNWERCPGAGACTSIQQTTTQSATYTLTASDVGDTIEVVETATGSDGNATASPAPTATVIALPPVNTAVPTISGKAQQGQKLTATTGTWTNTPTSYTYAWESCAGTTCTPISGATSSTYVIPATLVGHTIEVQVTASNSGGSGAPATSAQTSAVIALPPVNTALPKITGKAQQDQTLTATTGTWTNTPTSYTYAWQSCAGATCTAISGATSSTYLVPSTLVGDTIEVKVTATNTGGSTTATSAATAAVVPPAPTETFAPSISGTYVEGSVLTEQHGGWTNSPTSYSYAWIRCNGIGGNCAAITGATGQTYTLTAADVGATLVVRETATNAGGSGTADSALTPVITTPALVVPVPVSSSAPSVAGSPQQGQTLNESHATWSNNPDSYSYQWERCGGSGCSAIPGATNQSYTLTAADVGQSVLVLEKASNTGGSGAPVASARSAVVTATSTMTLVVVPTAPVTNQVVTLAATVTSSSGNAGPSGSVTFANGGSAIGGCSNESITSGGQSATLICQASFPAGTDRLAASYQPGGHSLVGGSTSAPQTIVVGQDSTSVSLAVTSQVAIHARATYTATLIPPVSNSGPIVPTGSIEFLDRGQPITGCRSRPLIQLAATCTIKYKLVGTHRIIARYSGDSNFAASASPMHPVHAVKSSPAPVVLGFIGSTLQWKFFYSPAYTQLLFLQAFGISNASTMRLTCTGSGCPFTSVSNSPAGNGPCPNNRHAICSTGSSINLLPVFRKRHLRAGAQITLRITRPRWVGKYYSFTIRSGEPPEVALACLAVGRTRPGVGC